jgi:heat shock protein HslJ
MTVILVMAVLWGCSPGRHLQNVSTKHFYWVNSQEMDCSISENGNCLAYQKGNRWAFDQWNALPKTIEGFNFEPGYRYKLMLWEIREGTTDAYGERNTRLKLIKVVDKQRDPAVALHNKWVLKAIKGKPLATNQEALSMEINIPEKQILGQNPCQNLYGKIMGLDDSKIAFGKLISSQKECDSETLKTYSLTLEHITEYRIQGSQLAFLDVGGEELLSYEKLD